LPLQRRNQSEERLEKNWNKGPCNGRKKNKVTGPGEESLTRWVVERQFKVSPPPLFAGKKKWRIEERPPNFQIETEPGQGIGRETPRTGPTMATRAIGERAKLSSRPTLGQQKMKTKNNQTSLFRPAKKKGGKSPEGPWDPMVNRIRPFARGKKQGGKTSLGEKDQPLKVLRWKLTCPKIAPDPQKRHEKGAVPAKGGGGKKCNSAG